MLNLFGRLKIVKNDQSGFTFIEMMVAIAILGVGVLAIVGLQTRTMSSNSKSQRQTEAYTLAMDTVESLMAADFADPLLDVTGGVIPPACGGSINTDPSQPPYIIDYEVHDTVSGAALADPIVVPPNSKRVVVVICWQGDMTTPVATLNLTRILSGI